MTRRLTVATLATGLAVGLLLAGCGVPTSSEVQRVAPGPEAASTSPGEGSPPPLPDAAATPQDQVDNFLQAAAGSPDTAADRVREYLSADARERWEPDEGVRVVRPLQEPFITDDVDGGWTVELTAQPVGRLHPHGYLDAPAATDPVDYQFRVVPEGDVEGEPASESLRLRIEDPPPFPLMTDSALAEPEYFYPHPIYFWDAERTTLVPDLRWLPLAGEPAEQHPWTVVRWLLEGPAPGLPRATALPAATQHVGTPVWEDGTLVVNFNAAAVEGQTADQFGTQLARSLLQLRDDAELELRIDDRPHGFTPQPRAWGRDEPTRFAVLDGEVRQLRDGGEATAPPPSPAALPDEVNSGIDAAALTARGALAAVVRTRADEQRQLSVVDAAAGGDADEHTTDLVADTLGQPVWLGRAAAEAPGTDDTGDERFGLVAADGGLHSFTSAGEVTRVPVSGLAGPVTDVAVAPERRRVALIAGDELYVAQLRQESGSVTVQAARRLATSLTDLAGVTFSHETQLVIAGERDGRVWLYDLTVDGGVEYRRRDLSNASVSGLVAHPVPDPSDAGVLMYEANGQAYTSTGVLHAEDLVDAPEDVEEPPRAPFFLG